MFVGLLQVLASKAVDVCFSHKVKKNVEEKPNKATSGSRKRCVDCSQLATKLHLTMVLGQLIHMLPIYLIKHTATHV